MIEKKKLMDSMVGISLAVAASIFIIPTAYKMMTFFLLILIWLIFGLVYYNRQQKILSEVKKLDYQGDYQGVVDYLNMAENKGYASFVYDSYKLYSLYVLGCLSDYERVAYRMSQDKQWNRPKNETLKSQVLDNVACIHLLKGYEKTNSISYLGDNLAILSSINDYHNQEFDMIISRIDDYGNLPLLKKACLYVLGKKANLAGDLYPANSEAKQLFDRIGEKENG